MFHSFAKVFSIFVLGILLSLTQTGCSDNDSDYRDKLAKLTEIQVSPATSNVLIGTSQQYTATAILDDSTTQNVTSSATWSTSDDSVATIDDNGIATGVNSGDVTITATYSRLGVEKTASASLHVVQDSVTITNLVITPVESLKLVGDTQAYKVEAVLDNGLKINLTDFAEYSSSDGAVATIDSDGIADAVGAGISTITASYDHKGTLSTATATLKVEDQSITITEIDVIAENDSLLAGSHQQYTATAILSNNDVVDITSHPDLVWASSQSDVATIDNNGIATALTAGGTVISAQITYEGVSSEGSAALTVEDIALTSIEISRADGGDNTDFIEGTELQAKATGTFSNGSITDITNHVIWRAVTSGTIAVDQTGLMTALAAGPATLSAEYKPINSPLVIDTVEGEVVEATITGLVVAGENEAPIGITVQLFALATYDNGDALDVTKQVGWTSSDENIAVVDENGIVTAMTIGDVNITAQFDGETAVHKIRVIDAVLGSIQIERGYFPDGGEIITELDVEITTEEYITAWGNYSDGSRRYINADAFWWSSDQQIASINSLKSSKVYGRDLGTATVTAYSGGLQASVEITVIPEEGLTLESIEIRNGGSVVTGGTIDIEVDDKSWVEAWGHYSDGSLKNINAKVFWSSSDLATAFILDEIDSYVHGISVGTATIKAEWQGKSAAITANIIPSTAPVLQTIEIQKNYVADGSGEVIDIANPLTISVGQEFYITAWGNYDDGSKRYINTDVLWFSEDYPIASMPLLQTSSNVTGVSVGTTEVYATLGVVEGRATVNVE